MLTDQQEGLAKRLLSGATSLYCGDHAYFGPGAEGRGAPTPGCKKCWMVWYVRQLATVPLAEIPERVERLYESVRNMAQLADAGQFDFEPMAHPDIQIEKDAA